LILLSIKREILLNIYEDVLSYCDKDDKGIDLFSNLEDNKETNYFNSLIEKSKTKVQFWDRKRFLYIQLEYFGDFITISPFDHYKREVLYYNNFDFVKY